MPRELRRLLIAPPRLTGGAPPAEGGLPLVPLEPGESHYLVRVLRLRCGDRLEVIDGQGRLWTALLEDSAALRLEQPRDQPLRRTPPPTPALALAMALPRRDVDVVWRMATELGADLLQPLAADRCVGREGAALPRWRTIAREATEQCERLWLPEVAEVRSARSWFGSVAGVRLRATTRREGLPLLAEALAAALPPPAPASAEPGHPGSILPVVTLAIGPEGGWTPEEEEAADGAGWQPVSLGPDILRTSTAAVAGLALLASWRTLSSAPSNGPSP